MINLMIETDIARPPADVFAYVTDPSKLASWQTNTVSATPEAPPPLAVGSRLREVHRAPGGKQLASLVEVTEYEPGHAFALHIVEGALPLDSRITFEPTESGTRMQFAVHGGPTGVMRLAEPLLRQTLKRQFAGQCATLKRILENGAPLL
jgi:uncharacterized protein YndB with AHSA1/START domain